MKKLFVAAAVLITVLAAGCKGSSDPKAVLVSFVSALSKKDFDGAKKLATTESGSMIDMMQTAMKSADAKEADKFDISKMEFGDAKIDGDKAAVPVKDKASGETTNFPLKKEDGKWKVAFDKSSLMQMATEKMNEKGGMDHTAPVMDSAAPAMDSPRTGN